MSNAAELQESSQILPEIRQPAPLFPTPNFASMVDLICGERRRITTTRWRI